MKNNIILEKSMRFAIRIVRFYQYICSQKHEYILSKQVLRSGTSIGANIRESIHGQSDKDFLSKLTIALKEADETLFWIELLYQTGYISGKEYLSIYSDCLELVRLLASITKTLKENISKSENTN